MLRIISRHLYSKGGGIQSSTTHRILRNLSCAASDEVSEAAVDTDEMARLHYGNYRQERVLTEESLSKDGLSALLNYGVLAVRIPNFCPPEVCDQLCKYLNSTDTIEYPHNYVDKETGEEVLEHYGVYRLPWQTPVSMAIDTKNKPSGFWESYGEEVRGAQKRMRAAVSPFVHPVDNLRVQVDELHEHGANVASYEGQRVLCGMVRMLRSEWSWKTAEQPHIDIISPGFIDIHEKFSANIYLDVPEKGGELEIWDVPPTPYGLEDEDNQDWRSQLPESLCIQPQRGDLVMLCTRRPHAIGSFEGGVRVSMQTFFGLKRGGQIQFWN